MLVMGYFGQNPNSVPVLTIWAGDACDELVMISQLSVLSDLVQPDTMNKDWDRNKKTFWNVLAGLQGRSAGIGLETS